MLARPSRLQAEKITALEHQLEWFRRQYFGQKSERFASEPDPNQLSSARHSRAPPWPRHTGVLSPTRGARRGQGGAESGEELKFFDESKVPVQTITLMHADLQGVPADQYEVIGEKVTYRIAQRPGAYHVIAYRRPVVKLKATGQILGLPAPEGVLRDSRADVSFGAGLLMDKFGWHMPLYRQHQRLEACGIKVSRPWLTQLAQALISLLTPIYEAQLASVRTNRVIAMDETPIKAGRSGHGKMHTGYFWPIYGEHDEVCFPFHTSRSADFVYQALSIKPDQCRSCDRRLCRIQAIRREDRHPSCLVLEPCAARLLRGVDRGAHERRRGLGADQGYVRR